MESLRELVKAWKDWESVWSDHYQGSSFEIKWEAFMLHLDLLTKEKS